MPIPAETIETVVAGILAEYRGRLPGDDTSPGSDAHARALVLALVQSHGARDAAYLQRQLSPETAEGEWLSRWGRVFGVLPTGATAAEGTLPVTGDGAITVTAGALLTTPGGAVFVVRDTASFTAPGSVTVDARDAGRAGNLPAGTTLTFGSPPLNADATAVVGSTFTGGADAEDAETHRARLLDHLANPPFSGNDAHYVSWARAVAGCRRAFVYPVFRGLGTVDVQVQGAYADGTTARYAPTIEDAVELSLADEIPNTVDLDVPVLATQSQDVDVRVEPDAAHPWDWTGTMTATPVSDTQFTVVTLPSGLASGDRVAWAPTTGILQVATLSTAPTGSGPYTITLASPGLVGLLAGGGTPTIYPGGDLSEAVRDALLAEDGVFDALTPGDTYGRRFPALSAANPSTLSRARMIAAVMGVEGASDVDVVAPASNVTPASQFVVRPRRLLVRPL